MFGYKKTRFRRIWKNTVMVMAAVVVFCTVYALVLPAITKASDPICGQTEHTHAEECYRTHEMVPQCSGTQSDMVVLHQHGELCYDEYGILVCPLQELQEHLHDETCRVVESTLVCLIDEIPAHTHGDGCYTQTKEPVCTLPECEPHAHSEACYAQADALICTQPECEPHAHGDACFVITEELVCTLPQCESHAHGDGCFDAEGNLICSLEETEGHTHGVDCTVMNRELICQLSETQGHTHGEDCTVKAGELICGLEETQGHAHGDDCFTVTEAFTCTMVETAGHTHDAACYAMMPRLVCEQEQVGVHTHDDSCLNEQGTVVCGITPAVHHDHDENCFRREDYPEPQLICTQTEHSHSTACYPGEEELPAPNDGSLCGMGIHTHGEGCYDENGQLTCSLMEHSHTATCFVVGYDPNADLENAEIWKASFADVKLSGNWARDVLAIAESQIGYRESAKNVVLLGDGSIKGYTRYGAWYGVPHGDWCAMFVSFCVNYAGATEVPMHSVCNNYIDLLMEAQLYRQADYLPKPGDIVFFDWERTGGEVTDVDHTGIVAEIIRDENGTPTHIRTIEGNWDNCVMYRTHDILSPTVIGYGEMPFGPAQTLLCQEDHTHSESCYGSSIFYSDDTLQAQLIVSGAELPEDLTFTVTAVTEELDPNRYGSMAAALEIATEESPFFVGDAGFYHITLLSGGEVYELPQGAKAVVDVTFTQSVFDPADVAVGSGLYTYLLSPGEPIALFTGDIVETYETQQAVGESYENATQGLTGVRLTLDNSSDFAVMLADTTMTGTFWTRVTDKSQLIAGETYMIISAEGNFAVHGQSGGSTAVVLKTVKDNTQYYTIEGRSTTLDNKSYWTFTPSGTSFTVRCQGTSKYLLGSTSSVVSDSSKALTLSYETLEKCWRIANGSRYLYINSSDAFKVSNFFNSGGYEGYYGYYYFNQDMLIFKKSDVTKLKVPEDVGHNSESGDGENAPEKPDYAPFIEPSSEKDGETSLVDPEDTSVSIPGFYYSDKATSKIEAKFDMDDYEKNKENDGKIHTDKSVIYGDDDYDAFTHYDPNTFGVTLSALGQEYKMPYEYAVRNPVDIVFVLDVSGSMTTNGTSSGGAAGSSASRAQNMVAAVNSSIKDIMDDHPANRVGIVLYATGAWELLPLDRYVADNDQYLQIDPQEVRMQNSTSSTRTIHFVETSDSLKNDDGVSFADLGRNFNQGYGTYTQAGIALGGKVFADIGNDVSYKEKIVVGGVEKEHIVNRQPVIILLSDGEPTHATNNYMDPISGPHYGDGQGTTENAEGIMGYNVVLTANYFKRMVGIQYNKPAFFYTVGMGIAEEGNEPMIEGSETSDAYKRAVLNPIKADIDMLSGNVTTGGTVNTQFKQLMNSDYNGTYVTVTPDWPDPWTGDPHTDLPVLQPNPYADNYSYSDGAYFGEPDADELAAIFSDIVMKSMVSTPYGFILHKSSSVVIKDDIGKGMCVLGDPVLRFAGVNHEYTSKEVNGNVTTYTYNNKTGEEYEIKYRHPYLTSYTYDISEIVVTVTTDAAGNQTVKMDIPDTALPAYTPELIGGQFYYEALPVRLIYQVGLTAESEKAVLELQNNGGSLTFYTNRWQNDGESVSNLYPSLQNPFYYEILPETGETRYHRHTDPKEKGTNVTNTLEYIVDCSKQNETYETGEEVTKVVHKLGNNGKLVFTYEPKTIDIPVEKSWAGGTKVVEDLQIQMDLYHVIPTGTGAEEATYLKSITLSAQNGWKGTFTEMPILTQGYYAIAEKIPEGYHAQYGGQTKNLVIDGKNVLVAVVDTSDTEAIPVTLVTNIPAVMLPVTGGVGAEVFYALGGLLIAAALVYIAGNGILRRKEVI